MTISACEVDNPVYPTAATADFIVEEQTEYEIDREIKLTDRSIPEERAEIVEWTWDFGTSDIPNSNEQNPAVLYEREDTYQITLTIRDSNGLLSTTRKTITVIDPANSVRLDWMSSLAESIQNTVSPALSPDEQTVYMVADNSTSDLVLYAYHAETGDTKWAFNLDHALAEQNPGGDPRLVYCSPSVGPDGTVYLALRDLQSPGTNRKSYLFAITANGTSKWTYDFGYDVNINYVTVAVDLNKQVYVGGLTNTPFNIVVLNSDNGEELNRINSPVGIRTGLSVSKAGDIYFASTGANGIYSYNIASASQNFNYQPSGLSTAGGAFSIDDDGTVYTTASLGAEGGILAFDANGNEKWVYRTSAAIDFGGVSIGTDGTLYASGGRVDASTGTSDGLVALNSNGELKWKFTTEEAVTNSVPVVDNREYVHFITDEGTYIVLRNDGTEFGRLKLGEKATSSAVMDAQGRVYLAVEETPGTSRIVRISSRASGVADSPWPMKGQDAQRSHVQK